MPAETVPVRMMRMIEAVAAELGQIDAADKGDLVIDDDDLLVVAVDRVLAGVQSALDSGAICEPVPDSAHGLACRRENRRPDGPPLHIRS